MEISTVGATPMWTASLMADMTKVIGVLHNYVNAPRKQIDPILVVAFYPNGPNQNVCDNVRVVL